MPDETGGRVFRDAWIAAVHGRYPGPPPQKYVAAYDEIAGWERTAAAVVFDQIRHFVLCSAGQSIKLSREQKGRFVALCWIAQIYRHFDDPKPSHVADYDQLPPWQREADADIFAKVQHYVMRNR